MGLDITAANSSFTLAVASLYPAGVVLDNFATDRFWETGERELAELQYSADGHLNAGYIFNPTPQTIHLSASSDSCAVFETIVSAQDAYMAIYRLTGTVILPATGRKYVGINGVLRTMNMIPSAGRVLETRQFAVTWEKVLMTVA